MVNRNCRACQSNENGLGNGRPNENHRCQEYLRQLQKIDFSMVDTILYLDAYPDSREALSYYHKLHAERKRLLAQMEAEHCPAVCNIDSASTQEWNWVNAPWPWEADAN